MEKENKNKTKQLKNMSPLYHENNKFYKGPVFYFMDKPKNKNKNNKKVYNEYNLANKSTLPNKLVKNCIIAVLAGLIYTNGFDIYLSSKNTTQNIQNDFDVDNTIENPFGEEEIETDENGQIIVDVSTDEEKQEILQKIKDLILRDSNNYGQNLVGIKDIISIDEIPLKEIAEENTFDNYLISIKFETINNEIYDMQFYADVPFELPEIELTSLDKISELIKYLNDSNKTAIYGYSQESQIRQEIKGLIEDKLDTEIFYVGEPFFYKINSGDLLYRIPAYYKDKNNQINIVLYSTIDTAINIMAQDLEPQQMLIDYLKNSEENTFTQTIIKNGTSFQSINSILSSYNNALDQTKTDTVNIYLDQKIIGKIKNNEISWIDNDEKE